MLGAPLSASIAFVVCTSVAIISQKTWFFVEKSIGQYKAMKFGLERFGHSSKKKTFGLLLKERKQNLIRYVWSEARVDKKKLRVYL